MTYRSSGVDISRNLAANDGASSAIPTTFNSRVVTRPGLFAGVIDLEGLLQTHPHLNAGIGLCSESSGNPGRMAKETLSNALLKIRGTHHPLAFLDYIASFPLKASDVQAVIESLCENLCTGSDLIPLIGGETAEMPGVFQTDKMELTSSMYSLSKRPSENSTNLRDEAEGLENPCLALSMDGVGTKSRHLLKYSHFPTALLDIFHHSLGDLLCLGARGIGMTIYIGCHEITHQIQSLQTYSRHLVFSQGLQIFDFEIHEAPDRYLPGEIDLVGSIAGLVDREKILTGDSIQSGDILLGLSSDGVHTNGYSLVNRILEEQEESEIPQWVIQALITPHKNYLPSVYPILEDSSLIKGIAHITGGGIVENLVRILPDGLGAEVDLRTFSMPNLFQWIQNAGNVPYSDLENKGMLETFNMGIGMILVASPSDLNSVLKRLKELGESPVVLGKVEKKKGESAHERIHCIS